MSYLSWVMSTMSAVMLDRIKSSPKDEIGIVFYSTVGNTTMAAEAAAAAAEVVAAALVTDGLPSVCMNMHNTLLSAVYGAAVARDSSRMRATCNWRMAGLVSILVAICQLAHQPLSSCSCLVV